MCKTWHSKLKVNLSDRDRAGWNERKPHISLRFLISRPVFVSKIIVQAGSYYFARSFSTFYYHAIKNWEKNRFTFNSTNFKF